MNKRSAMLMAAGLVFTMIVAGIAITAGLTGPSASAAAPRAARQRAPKPIVKTIRSTHTVHKKAPQTQAVTTFSGVAPVATPSVSYPSPSSTGGYVDDSGHGDDGSHSGGGGDD
jgi:hypothetical protein